MRWLPDLRRVESVVSVESVAWLIEPMVSRNDVPSRARSILPTVPFVPRVATRDHTGRTILHKRPLSLRPVPRAVTPLPEEEDTMASSTAAATLSAVLVDDEPLARRKIRDLVEDDHRLEVVAECRDGREAVETILRLRPDLVFLDVQMPELDGFGVIREVGAESMPTVIFTTAFDEFAVRAFDAAAADYLLKPYDRERFRRAVERAVDAHRRKDVEALGRRVEKLIQLGLDGDDDDEPDYPDRLVVKRRGTVHLVRTEEIAWIEAARNYVKIHCDDGAVHKMRETMTRTEETLDPERFLRIHRSTIVNVDRIRKIEPGYGSESRVELEDGTRLMISRAYRRGRVKEMLEELG